MEDAGAAKCPNMPVLVKLPGEKAPAAPAAGGTEEEEGGVLPTLCAR